MNIFLWSVFHLKSIFISSCVGPVYKDITYTSFYMLSLPISSLCPVGQTIDELLQAVKLNWTPSMGEGLLLQHRMTHPRTSSICHVYELNHHKAQFQNAISKLGPESSSLGIGNAQSLYCDNRTGSCTLLIYGVSHSGKLHISLDSNWINISSTRNTDKQTNKTGIVNRKSMWRRKNNSTKLTIKTGF